MLLPACRVRFHRSPILRRNQPHGDDPGTLIDFLLRRLRTALASWPGVSHDDPVFSFRGEPLFEPRHASSQGPTHHRHSIARQK